MLKIGILALFLAIFIIPEDLVSSCSSAEKIPTQVIVRVTSKDAKVIGSGVGGAFVRISNLETGEVLASGKQQGGTGDTDRLMVKPHRRGEILYGGAETASFKGEILLERPTQVEIYAEAPLGFPQAIQKGSKTLTLIPGRHILGDGVVIELNGLIVNALSPAPKKCVRPGEEIEVQVEIRML